MLLPRIAFLCAYLFLAEFLEKMNKKTPQIACSMAFHYCILCKYAGYSASPAAAAAASAAFSASSFARNAARLSAASSALFSSSF